MTAPALPTHIVRPAEIATMARSLIVAEAVSGDGNIVLPLDRSLAGHLGRYLERTQVLVTRWDEVRAHEAAANARLEEARAQRREAIAALERAAAEFRLALWMNVAALVWVVAGAALWVLQ